MEYQGNAHFKASPFIRRFLPDNNDVKVDMTLPPILVTGVSSSLGNKWTIEFDVFWVGWSSIMICMQTLKKMLVHLLSALTPLSQGATMIFLTMPWALNIKQMNQ